MRTQENTRKVRNSSSQVVLSRVQLTLHATRRTPHGASRLVQPMPAWLVKTRRARSRRCRDTRVYVHMTTAMHEITPPPTPYQRNSRAGKRVAKFTKDVGSTTAKEVTQLASAATGWGSAQLRQWGLLEDDDSDKGFRLLKRGKENGVVGKKTKRPLGVSIDLGGMFGQTGRSMYSAPPAGGTRKPGYRGDPLIPVRRW